MYENIFRVQNNKYWKDNFSTAFFSICLLFSSFSFLYFFCCSYRFYIFLLFLFFINCYFLTIKFCLCMYRNVISIKHIFTCDATLLSFSIHYVACLSVINVTSMCYNWFAYGLIIKTSYTYCFS